MSFLFKNKKAEPPQFSEIGINSAFDGELSSKNAVYVNGETTGIIKSEKIVETGEKSVVKGKIFSQDIVIKGEFGGYLEAKEKIVITCSAKIDGEIKTKTIKIEKGGAINGKII
jgi:cytoskeletal protein CcmA (bactofilin family)